MSMRATFPDRLAVNLPDGMKPRLQTVAAQQGMNMSTYLRISVMDRLQIDEARLTERRVTAEA